MKITVVKSDGKATLTEAVISGRVERRIVPSVQVVDGEISEQDFENGIDYGLPFDEIIQPADITGKLTTALHNSDVWTLEDLTNKGQAVQGALQSVYQIERATIIQAAEKYLKETPAPKPVAPAKKSTKKE